MVIDSAIYCGPGSSLDIASEYQNSYHLFDSMKVYVNNLCLVFLYYLSEQIFLGSDISPSLESLKKRGQVVTPTHT